MFLSLKQPSHGPGQLQPKEDRRILEPRRESSLAAGIVAGIDPRALGGAIADALQWRVGDSDDGSHSDLTGPQTGLLSGRHIPTDRALGAATSVQPVLSCPVLRRTDADLTEAESRMPTGPTAHTTLVAGTGTASALVVNLEPTPSLLEESLCRMAFVKMSLTKMCSIWCENLFIVHTLYNHLLARRVSDSATKAYTLLNLTWIRCIARVMDPRSWPMGLTVRPPSFNPITGGLSGVR